MALQFHGTHNVHLLFSTRHASHPLARSRRLTLAAQGPSCIFVGPVETASQEMVEALYHQARNSYYNGKPLILDDMFDKVELKLRLYGSKSVIKYPRCSLRRQCAYADAEEDPSQVMALASVWSLFLAFGGAALLLPTLYSIHHTYNDVFGSNVSFSRGKSPMEWLTMVNGMLFVGLGCSIGYLIASASVQALQGLWQNDLVALKGCCPNCGEEIIIFHFCSSNFVQLKNFPQTYISAILQVFAFVKAGKSNKSRHHTECHVCQCLLEFRTKTEQSVSSPRRRYGRVYLVRRPPSRRQSG